MPNRHSFRVPWVALIPILAFPLYGQTSCEPCPNPTNPCKRAAGRSTETNQCVYANQADGTACDYQGVTGICWGGECLATECAGVPSYGFCNDPVGGGSVGACIEDLCILAAPEDQCVKVGVGRINCCSQAGCFVASGAYCNDPLTGVSCDPSGIEPPGQAGQDGICSEGTCVALSGLCAGVSCPTTADDPCARDYCNPDTGQCDEWIVDTFTECLTANSPGLCLGGTCEQIGGGECNGEPCESSECVIAACRLPCTYKSTGCTPNDLAEETPQCFKRNRTNGLPCDGAPGTCFNGACAFGGCQTDEQCEDGNPCTDNYCDPFGQLCDTSGAVPVADGTPCAQNDLGQVLALCENGVCLPDLCIGRDCSDGKSCTDDVCTSPYGICSNPRKADGEPCDGEPGECLFGVCEPVFTGCNNDGDCNDNNPCTADDCDPFGQLCSNPPEPNGTRCTTRFGEPGQCLLGSCLAL